MEAGFLIPTSPDHSPAFRGTGVEAVVGAVVYRGVDAGSEGRHSFMQEIFPEHLLVPGIVLDAQNAAVQRQAQSLPFWSLCSTMAGHPIKLQWMKKVILRSSKCYEDSARG